MDDVIVSIIVPIYNVSKFINRGIAQLLKQSYKNYEILLVDDGSTDGSYEECKKRESEDQRIIVLQQENKGAGGARNLGIEKSRGKYIYFYDIDDCISPNLLEYNVSLMETYNVDICVFGYKSYDITCRTETIVTFPETMIENNNQLRDIYVDEFVLKVNGFTWNKFYRKEFLDKYNIRFESQRIQQDEVFNILCYHFVEKLFISPKVLYDYFVYDKGNTRSRFIPDRFDIYKSVRLHFENLKEFWALNDKRFDNYLSKRFYYSVINCVFYNLLHPSCNFTEQKKKEYLRLIMNDPLTIDSFRFAENANLGLEQYLYRYACRKASLFQVKLFAFIFSTLRRIYRRLNYI